MEHLKFWLYCNAVFSVTSGLCLLFANQFLQTFLGIHNADILPSIGISLLLFASCILFIIKYHLKRKNIISLIIFLDVMWVIGSCILIIFQLFTLTTKGYWLIGIVGFIVGWFAKQQYKYKS
ncbi:hypothetical protein [uncultured Kordia sp.]|uniref:hypothetical protein n=1 Tax=uncultured Kordia sp. TaxID=507699 RepID=UPI002623488A|nr:hypothetical protein [uncultured Kordia sp.]